MPQPQVTWPGSEAPRLEFFIDGRLYFGFVPVGTDKHGCRYGHFMGQAGKVPPVITYEDCSMATNRSQRLRKKLCVDEFQEVGFELNLDFKQDLDDDAIDAFLDAFLTEAMDANNLNYVGGEDFGLVCLKKRGSVNEEQRAVVEGWLKARSELTEVTVSPLIDVWYPEKPINPVA
jgi:uncharacterized protein YggL (DUF469 family)